MADTIVAAQDVPLGGQPVRKTVSVEQMQANASEGKELVGPVHTSVIDAINAGLKKVEGKTDRFSQELRNHYIVYRDQLQDLVSNLK